MFTSIEDSCDLRSDYIMLVESDELKDLRLTRRILKRLRFLKTGWTLKLLIDDIDSLDDFEAPAELKEQFR